MTTEAAAWTAAMFHFLCIVAGVLMLTAIAVTYSAVVIASRRKRK